MSYKAPPSIESYVIVGAILFAVILTPFIAIAALVVALVK